ncbi:hypothetical protein GYMLUDRAFT_290448 [Collybiopsis luxurians FD-317 M1]|nr:hypothetical protein GYMLUDRAFT_290448 [Collybiopsis luxurians FD-317 M1]
MLNVFLPSYVSKPTARDAYLQQYALSLQGYQTPLPRTKRSSKSVVHSPHADRLSPEYNAAVEKSLRVYPQPLGGCHSASNIEKDIHRALRAQERAKMRKAALEASPQSKKVLISSAVIPNTQRYSSKEVQKCGGGLSNSTDSAASVQYDLSMKRENERSIFRFLQVKGLSHFQRRRRPSPSLKSVISDEFSIIPPPNSQCPPAIGITHLNQNSKHITPLPRYDPFLRPRADSMSSVISPRSFKPVDADLHCVDPLASPHHNLKRVATFNDIFDRIHRQAANMGVKAAV